MKRPDIEAWYRGLQERFCIAIEAVDGSTGFVSEVWARPGGGGGDTRILTEGRHIEKAAVNFSAVWGSTPTMLSDRLAAAGDHFYASGVSIIVHPRNPFAPTFHANLRYFEADGGTAAWFGGGADLTPCYFFEEDARGFHEKLKEVCERHAVADHGAWKQACDQYFYLPHRGEARGVGGIFFDHLDDRLAEVWAFQKDLGNSLFAAYGPILERRIVLEHGARQRHWQELRRGRYVEFNLIWDRGTRFGLETGGRTESILASLPPRARWDDSFEPESDSQESATQGLLLAAPVDWA